MEQRDLLGAGIAVVLIAGGVYLAYRKELKPEGASIAGFSYQFKDALKPGASGELLPVVRNTASIALKYMIVVLFGEVNILGLWETDNIMTYKLAYPYGIDGCAIRDVTLDPGVDTRVSIPYTIPIWARMKNYDVWVMVFYGSTRLAERKFLDSFPVFAAKAEIKGWDYSYAMLH